jgi:preprotein translocase subunit YajC
MFQNVLSSIEDVGLMPSITFLVFFIFFIVVCFLAIKLDKKSVKMMSELPLEETQTSHSKFF